MSRNGTRLFTDTKSAQTEKQTKGRNAELVAQRDELLINRYVYYTVHTELRMEAINERLAAEFHLSETRLLHIIYGRVDEIKTMKTDPPTLKQLAKKYPHFSWNY